MSRTDLQKYQFQMLVELLTKLKPNWNIHGSRSHPFIVIRHSLFDVRLSFVNLKQLFTQCQLDFRVT